MLMDLENVGKVNTEKDMAYLAEDLTDSEIVQVYRTIISVRNKYAGLPNTAENLDKLRDEALTRLMEIGVVATLDVSPCFYGEPPAIEILGKVEKSDFDHERYGYEIKKAHSRNEEYLGEKEPVNKKRRK